MSSANELSDSSDEHSRSEQSIEEQLLIFFTPQALRCIQRKSNDTIKHRYTSIGEKYNMCFKMIRSDSRLVKTILFSYGFLQGSSKNQHCNLLWTNTHVGGHVLRSMRPWQRMNHFPRSFMITKKDTLYECIDRSMICYGKCFDFIPIYFCTPLNAEKRENLALMLDNVESGVDSPFIVKPACSSRGRDISFLRSRSDLDKLDNCAKLLISRYVDRPFLVNNLKSDLRVYVLVTSFYPLIVYVYSDGLARFAVHEYNAENRRNYDDINTHLTNYSLNKNSAEFIRNKDVYGENIGHKWTLGAFLREMKKLSIDTELLMVRIEDIIIKTLLSVQGSIASSCRKFNLHPNCCFELFGFDILIDEDLKPWLLEVNLSPSLACDAPLDSVLKANLLCDTLNIASIPLVRDRNAKNRCATASGSGAEEEEIQSNNLANNRDMSSKSSSTSVTSDDPTRVNEQPGSGSKVLPLGSDLANSGLRKRKIASTRVSKVRRAKVSFKQTFTAEKITPQYLQRATCHFSKVETESLRKGRFVRIFPRTTTWNFYGWILEDVGQERWDEDLHLRLNKNIELPESSRRDIETAHSQLIDAKKFPSRADLHPVVRDVLLREALSNAEKYAQWMFSDDARPFPAALPFVRPEARRRTQSQTDAEEMRRTFLLNKRQQLLEQIRKSNQSEIDVSRVGDAKDSSLHVTGSDLMSSSSLASFSGVSSSSHSSSVVELRSEENCVQHNRNQSSISNVIRQPVNVVCDVSECETRNGDVKKQIDNTRVRKMSCKGSCSPHQPHQHHTPVATKTLAVVSANFVIKKKRRNHIFLPDRSGGY